MASPDNQRPQQGQKPFELSPIHRINHNIIWPALAHTLGLRILHQAYMYGFAKIKEGDHVLELGAGDVPYFRILGFSKKAETFTVVDIDPSVLARSRGISEAIDRRDARRGRQIPQNVEFVEAPAQQLPLPDNSVDKIIISNLDTAGYATEAYRVAKPGATVMEAWLEPLVPIFSWAKMKALHDAGFRNLRLVPGTPTVPLPINHIFPHSPIPVAPFMNWVVFGEKPDPSKQPRGRRG